MKLGSFIEKYCIVYISAHPKYRLPSTINGLKKHLNLTQMSNFKRFEINGIFEQMVKGSLFKYF